jgi:putative ABC transport system permease protein
VALTIGIPASLAINRLLAAMLFGVGSADGPTYGATAVGIIALGLTASWLPARRASRTDPLSALRAE